MKEDDSRKFMREILEGVKYIHGKNIIHRDLKVGFIHTAMSCLSILQ